MALRRELYARGLRYRVDWPLPTNRRRRADIAFGNGRVAVFVDGCFWHGCPAHSTVPRSNREWWMAKLQANQSRDRETDRQLRAAGWEVVRVWEHEDPALAAERVAVTIARRRSGRTDFV